MKRNYFGKLLAIAMIFAGFSLTSCDKNDNAIIDGEIFEPSTVKKVDGGAVVTASTPAEVSRMITRLRKEIVEAAENNETYTITINAAALNATATDNIISLLTVNNSDLVVNFTGAITTDEPLVLQSKGVDENANPSNPAMSKVAINLPGGTSDIDLQVNMPTASVTLKPTSGSLGINELSAKTAWTTLNIESGVTVNWLHINNFWNNGYVVVKDGGKINGAITDEGLEVYEKGILLTGVYNDSIRKTTDYTAEDSVYVQTVRILKKEDSYEPSYINLFGAKEIAQKNIPEIIISDGAYAWIGNVGWFAGIKYPYVNITGEGNASMLPYGSENPDGTYSNWGGSSINLGAVNKLTNVTVDFSKAIILVQDPETYNWSGSKIIEPDDDFFWGNATEINLPMNSEGCTFKAKRFETTSWDNISDDIASLTHKNSTFTFDNLKSEELPIVNVRFPGQTDKRKSFTVAFDSCEFDQLKINSDFWGDVNEFKAYKGYISFDSSKIGGKAITKSTDMIQYVNNYKDESDPKSTVILAETFFTIDGVNYKPAQVEGKWMLIALDE